jgi:hypothetical protein
VGDGGDYTPVLSAVGLLATAVLLYSAVRLATSVEGVEEEGLVGSRAEPADAEHASLENALPDL